MADVEMKSDPLFIDEPMKKRSRLIKFSEVQKSTGSGESEKDHQFSDCIAQQASQDNS